MKVDAVRLQGLASLTAYLLLTSCSGADSVEEADLSRMLPRLQVFVEPGHLWTAIPPTVHVELTFGAGPVTRRPSAEQALESAELRRYPSGEPLAAAGTWQTQDSYVLAPDADLEPGFFGVFIDESANGIEALDLRWPKVPGGYESVFRVGSEPLVLGIAACASQTVEFLPKLRLDFSETVSNPGGDASVEVIVDGASQHCALYDPWSESAASFGLTCVPAIAATAEVEVRFAEAFVTENALQAAFLSGEQSVVLGDLVGGCRSWRQE